MKQRYRTYFMLALFLLISYQTAGGQIKAITVLKEETLIKQAVEDYYIKGLRIRDFSLIKTICIPETVLMSARQDGTLGVTTLEKWSQRFDPKNPPFKKLDALIETIDKEGTAAQVKIQFIVDSQREVTDYLHMLKLEGRWRIVHIIDY